MIVTHNTYEQPLLKSIKEPTLKHSVYGRTFLNLKIVKDIESELL